MYGGYNNVAPVKEGDEIDVKIEAIGDKGDGITKKDGFVLVVPGAQLNDEVRIRVTKVLRKVGFAEVVGKSGETAEEPAAEEPAAEEEAPAEEDAEAEPKAEEEVPAEESADAEPEAEKPAEEEAPAEGEAEAEPKAEEEPAKEPAEEAPAEDSEDFGEEE